MGGGGGGDIILPIYSQLVGWLASRKKRKMERKKENERKRNTEREKETQKKERKKERKQRQRNKKNMMRSLPPPPPPPPSLECRRGRRPMRVLIFVLYFVFGSGVEGSIFGRCLGIKIFVQEKLEKEVLKPMSSWDMGCFSEASQKIKGGGGGYDLYVHVSRAFNRLPIKRG